MQIDYRVHIKNPEDYFGSFYQERLTDILAWISIHAHYFLSNVIIHPFPIFRGRLAEWLVWAWK